MDITAIAGVGIISAVLTMIVRQYKPEMALPVSVGCGIVLLLAVISLLSPSVAAIEKLTSAAELSGSWAGVLLKALGICYISQLAADCCRDSGEAAIATKVELAGKAALMAVSLPVFTQLAEMVTKMIQI